MSEQVDSIIERYTKPGSPGCALAVMEDGEIIYRQCYGMANLEHDIPISPSTVFNIGSMAKQFTTFAIALLEDEGQLSCDDDFRKGLEGEDFVREMIFGPTLNIDGFLAGQLEAGIKTIVLASAKCQLDIRLVPDMTLQEVLDKVRAHLDRHGFEDVKLRFLAGS